MTGRSLRLLLGLALIVLAVTVQPTAHAGALGRDLPPAAQQPIAGSGSGGAFGPSVITSFQQLPSVSTPAHPAAGRVPPPPRSPALNSFSPLPAASARVQSRDASVNDSTFNPPLAPASPASSPSIKQRSFTTGWQEDIDGASDGRYILADATGPDTVSIFTLSGSVVQATPRETFWCGGASPLPVCSGGGFDGDDRTFYDPGSARWLMTALWVFGSNFPPAADVLAVSQTSDPTAGWYLYQFPACGAFDTWDGSDQPHTGFNNLWIVVASACSASSQGVNGAGLAVFDKSQLYSGDPLTLNQNWFEFVDPYSGEGPYSGIGGNGERDNPVATYAPTTNNREYLTASTMSGSQASVIYSFIEGSVDAPVYVAATEIVTSSFQVNGTSTVDAPGCTACLGSYANTWIHSSGVWAFHDGIPYILSTMVLGDPGYRNATQIISIATNTQTGAATALQVAGGLAGAGPLAAEIAMPLVRSGGADRAVIVYDFSAGNFYPGVKSVTWNVDKNTVLHRRVLQQGSLTPTPGSFQANRWVDFIDALVPIPGSTRLVLGATLAVPSASSSQGSTYWATVTP
jgi:hypothetical protein